MEKKNLNKLIAENSNFSRRQVDELLRSGQIKINGETAMVGDRASEQDEIKIKEEKIIFQKKVYIKLNKPVGYVCTNKSFPGEKNIFSLISLPERLSSIGRLDKDSSGLILLTNDGDLNYKLSHPKFQYQKKYLVTLKNSQLLLNPPFLNNLKKNFIHGVNIGEKSLAKAQRITRIGHDSFEIILSEGKKRQVRKMFETLGLQVIKLKRVEFAGITLKGIKDGEWVHLTPEEINILKK